MQNILNGFLRYRSKLRGELLQKFESVSDNPSVNLNIIKLFFHFFNILNILKPQALIVTCVDSRIVASRITQASPGETLICRNPGFYF